MLSITLASLISSALLATAAVHDIQVGKDGLSYSPEAIAANPGDTVVFHFMAKNHTATQSSFANPCGRLDGGFDSDFQPVAPGVTDFPTFTYTVTSTTPVWVYCKQAAKTPQSHCGQGMVFAINCGADGAPNSFTNFKNSALAIGAQLSADAGSGTASATDAAATPAPTGGEVVTATISLDSSSWATTYTSFPNSPNPTPASLEGQVHVVTVGGNGNLTYEPSRISAQPRDIISFHFTSKNHTATQSSFAFPCRKLESTSQTNQVGFDSGFMFIANGSAPMVWNVTVNDTAPIWVYCRQQNPIGHCGTGMVFAVNSDETPTSQKNFAMFQAAAKAQNGTNASAASGSGSANPTPTSGSTQLSVGLTMVLVGLVACLMA